MKLRKRITAMLICILMVTGMIMGSTQTTLALKFVTRSETTTDPAVPGMGVDLQFQKYLYAKNGDASILNNIIELNVTIQPLYYTPADGGAAQSYDANSDDNYEVADWMTIEGLRGDAPYSEEEDTISPIGEKGQRTATFHLDWGDDTHTYKRIPEYHGVLQIGGIMSHSSYTPVNSMPQDSALIPPGVYTFEVTEEAVSNNLITYDQDKYFMDIYVSNILDATVTDSKEPVILVEEGGLYTETCITNVTVWKGQNLGQLSSNPAAASGNASDVTNGDTVNGEIYNSNPNDDNYTAPGGTWNAEWDSSKTYVENIENLKNTNALGKVSSTTTVTDTTNSYLEVTIPFTNAYEKTDLVVSKEVTGNYANLDEVFTYPVTVTDTTATDGTEWDVKYYATDDINTEVTGEALTTLLDELYPQIGDNPDPKVTSITNGTPANIHLKDGYTFKIRSLSDQATYTISEDAVQYYEPSYVMTAGHSTAANEATINATTNDDKTTYTVAQSGAEALETIEGSTASKGIYSTTTTPPTYVFGTKPENIEGTQLVTAGTPEDVIITFTNHRDYVAPTGFVMSILPYVGAFVAVLAALAAFIVWKKKRTDQTTGTGL